MATKLAIARAVVDDYKQSGQLLDEVITAAVKDIVAMLDEIGDELQPLSSVMEEALSFTSPSRRICRVKVCLERQLGKPGTNPFTAALPSGAAYAANPSLALKDEVAGKILALTAASGHQRAETRLCCELIRRMVAIDDIALLQVLSHGLDSWPRISSLEFSRLQKASMVVDEYVETHAEVSNTSAPYSSMVAIESLKLGVLKWLVENGESGWADERMQESCIRMLQTQTYSGPVLANLQWALANLQWESISLPYTRLRRAEEFLKSQR